MAMIKDGLIGKIGIIAILIGIGAEIGEEGTGVPRDMTDEAEVGMTDEAVEDMEMAVEDMEMAVEDMEMAVEEADMMDEAVADLEEEVGVVREVVVGEIRLIFCIKD